jgi:phosphatidylethanolamine-binding protein (PEBP) family uncharacterized protein
VPEGKETTKHRVWLTERRNEMQRDAQSVGKGIVYVGPPPAMGGQYQPHSYFADLFGDQTYTDEYPPNFRLSELATVIHELQSRERQRLRDTFNPRSWFA